MKLKTKILGAVAAPIAGLALLAVAVDSGPAIAAPAGTAVHAQAGGQGMMGGGQGMTGRGAMRPGQGMAGRGAMGPGQGMAGRGMMSGVQGMMGGMMKMMHAMMSQNAMGRNAMGQGVMSQRMRVVPSLNVTVKDVRLFMEKRLGRLGNKRLKVGPVKQADARTITADIVTVDNSLVQRFTVDRATGWVKKAK